MSQVGDETWNEFNQGWRIEPVEDGLAEEIWTQTEVASPYYEILPLPCPYSNKLRNNTCEMFGTI